MAGKKKSEEVEAKREKKDHGLGNIRKRKDGKAWDGEVMIDGTRRYFSGKSEAEVKRKIKRAKAEAEMGLAIEPNQYTVKDWLDIWLEKYSRISVSPGTYADHRYMIDAHLIPTLGSIKLSKLTAAEVQDMINKKLTTPRIVKGKEADPLSPRTVVMILGVLKQALKQAALEGFVQRNVADFVKRPRMEKKEARHLTHEETTLILEEAKKQRVPTLYYLLQFLLGSGLRIGEAGALKWADLDLDEGILQVKQSTRRVMEYDSDGKKLGTQIITKEPKTKSGRRSVPLPPWCIDDMEEWRMVQAEMLLKMGVTDPEFVFTTVIGTQLDTDNARRELDIVLERLDLKGISFHSVRHTYATRLLEMNVNAKTAQELLGHSNIAMTLDTYSHVMPDLKKDAVSQWSDRDATKQAIGNESAKVTPLRKKKK
ncbi:tyrosine-type recombinase/integrase [Acidaminobacter hydrogenoformans]|uniref:Site-specific recombinase XerD n=1 Tax=Acidaminobacter hydrogenoformans DSM 2784 TaxID=1120920 RepID=A0A1G5S6Z5_9FIRM|nr:site-specific integrase [Acidaminobacter hydrogenoformans]SCZ82083.1 Site-specific recombinase XerD [Acidaminobacter hydrogenoformans DSM 2784]